MAYSPGTHDRLDAAARLMTLLALIGMLATLYLAADLLRGRAAALAPAQTLVRLLALREPSLIPSGRPGRGPVIAHPAVDPRHTPLLAPWDPACRGALLVPCTEFMP